jgi:hypothetical protein
MHRKVSVKAMFAQANIGGVGKDDCATVTRRKQRCRWKMNSRQNAENAHIHVMNVHIGSLEGSAKLTTYAQPHAQVLPPSLAIIPLVDPWVASPDL